MTESEKERAIRSIVETSVKTFASAFSEKHLSQLSNSEGIINSKIHNVFIAALGPEIQYYSALCRSLDSSLGNMLEAMAIGIAKLNFEVTQEVEGTLYQEQTDYIAELLEKYKSNEKKPQCNKADYLGLASKKAYKGSKKNKRHVSDYYLHDLETDILTIRKLVRRKRHFLNNIVSSAIR